MTDGYARRALGGTASAGEPDPAGGRRVEGLAVPWDAEATGTLEFGELAERFDRAAFDAIIAAGRPVPLLNRHDGEVVGVARELWAAPDGLRYRGGLLDTPAARDYAAGVAAGVDGVSVEFRPGKVRRGARHITHTAVDRLAAIAGAYAPALMGASVALRGVNVNGYELETEPTPTPEPEPDPTPTPGITEARVSAIATAIAHREAAELRRLYGEGATHRLEATGPVFRSLADAWRAVDGNRADPGHRDWYTRALADITTADVPGVMGVGGQVRGIVDPGRPGVTAFGREALGDNGMSVDWPYYAGTLSGLVGVQATEKTEIVSAKVPILKGSSPIQTVAGGADISYQTLRRSNPAYLEAWSRIMLAAYAATTDALFVNALELAATGTATLDWATATPEAVRAAVFAASVTVQNATGRPASFILAAADTFGAIGGALVPVNPTNANGTADAASLAPVLSGLRVFYDPNVDAGSAIVSNGLAAALHEDGPFQASEEDVAKLGRNVAYYGMIATAVYIPAGIVEMKAGVAGDATSRRRG